MNIEDIPQINKFLKPITVDDKNISIFKPYVENKKDLRCRLNNIHTPESQINWKRDPFRILTKEALIILNEIHNKMLFAMSQRKSNYSKIINMPKDKFNNLNQAVILNNNKKKLDKCMYLIEDNMFMYIDENNIDQEVSLKESITLLQIFKDQFFKKNLPHITCGRCLYCKIQNWKYYHNWREKFKNISWEIMTDEEETLYHIK
jgi:hypothetical protein